MPSDNQRPAFVPTPSQIIDECEVIRSGWTEAQRQNRNAEPYGSGGIKICKVPRPIWKQEEE